MNQQNNKDNKGKKKVVVARLTAVREVGVRTIIEVYTDASFHSFFQFFTQEGLRRSTKKLVRSSNRNEGLAPWHRAYRMTPGLEVIAEHLRGMKQFKSVTVRIIRRRAYRQLLAAAPDVLGLTKVERVPDPRLLPKTALRYTAAYPVNIPQGYLTIKKRVSILTGRG